MTTEELLATITKLPVLERVHLLDALLNLRVITVQDAHKALNTTHVVSRKPPVKAAAKRTGTTKVAANAKEVTK